MRRALFIAVLMADASVITSLLVPETCPDRNKRISARQRLSSVLRPMHVRLLCRVNRPLRSSRHGCGAWSTICLSRPVLACAADGNHADILHVPKTFLT